MCARTPILMRIGQIFRCCLFHFEIQKNHLDNGKSFGLCGALSNVPEENKHEKNQGNVGENLKNLRKAKKVWEMTAEDRLIG